MKRIAPSYSRSEVNKAGEILIDLANASLSESSWALDVMNNWRAAHDYPVNTFQANLRSKINKRGYQDALVVQRLKRITSIIAKLEKNPSMNLSRMHDIGGLRAIVNTVGQVNALKRDFITSRFRHKLVREYDYIAEPKTSGYRGIHLVYQYFNNRAPEYDGFRLELQIRSKLQHAWATAVETMGTFLDTSLKSSEGPEKWLEFFSICGAAFSLLEKCPLPNHFEDLSTENITSSLKQLEDDLDVVNSLKIFGATIQALDAGNLKHKYFLLMLQISKKQVTYEGFSAEQLDKATERYLKYEREFGDQSTDQVVLVSGDSIKALRRAYPNYFLDTHEFVKQLNKYYEKFIQS